jgi:hypothetical protein
VDSPVDHSTASPASGELLPLAFRELKQFAQCVLGATSHTLTGGEPPSREGKMKAV